MAGKSYGRSFGRPENRYPKAEAAIQKGIADGQKAKKPAATVATEPPAAAKVADPAAANTPSQKELGLSYAAAQARKEKEGRMPYGTFVSASWHGDKWAMGYSFPGGYGVSREGKSFRECLKLCDTWFWEWYASGAKGTETLTWGVPPTRSASEPDRPAPAAAPAQ